MLDLAAIMLSGFPALLAADGKKVMFGILALALGYVLGSVSFGIIIPRILGGTRDIRTVGSGNAGTTNVLRTQGKKQALLVLIGDVCKGMLGAWLGALILPGLWGSAIAGIGTVMGHSFPLYFNLKGGKGVATGVGALLVMSPQIGSIALLVFILVVILTRWVSFGSMLGAASLIPLCWLFEAPIAVVFYSYFMAAFVIWRHRSNIKKLLSGTESKLGEFRKEGKQ